MSQTDFDVVVLQGTTYLIPKSAATPSWGEELNDYLKALGTAFATVVGPADIQETSATIANNISSATNIVGLTFDPSIVRAAFVDYSIYRTTNSNVVKEAGSLILLYDTSAPVNTKWSFTRESNNDAEVTLTVTDAGQVQYQSSNITGTSYVGISTFRARAVLQS